MNGTIGKIQHYPVTKHCQKEESSKKALILLRYTLGISQNKTLGSLDARYRSRTSRKSPWLNKRDSRFVERCDLFTSFHLNFL